MGSLIQIDDDLKFSLGLSSHGCIENFRPSRAKRTRVIFYLCDNFKVCLSKVTVPLTTLALNVAVVQCIITDSETVIWT